MRHPALAAIVLLGACASGAGQLYLKSGDSAFAGGRWGEAMAAYDAAHNEAPNDAAIVGHRRDAAARWVEAIAPELAKSTPPEKALVLLSSLADEGKKRGADAAVSQHVVPLLDAAVSRLWNGEAASDEPKVLWEAVSRGELLTQSLPETSPKRQKLEALKQHAFDVFQKLSEQAKHRGTAYLYSAMASYIGGQKPRSEAVSGLQSLTEFDYRVAVEAPKSCPQLEAEFRKRLAFFKNMEPHEGGLPAAVTVIVDCVPLAQPTQRQEKRAWVEEKIEQHTIPGSCVDRRNMTFGGTIHQYTRERMGGITEHVTVDVPPTYSTVHDCDPPTHYSTTSHENKADVVTITTQEYGFNAGGAAILSVEGKDYRMPLSSRVVFEKVTTEGKVFGTKEDVEVFDRANLLALTAHGIWIELVFLAEAAHEGVAADLVKRAAGEEGDARLGDMVSAVRVHHGVTKDFAKWFAEQLGINQQELGELVIDAARVKPSLKAVGDYHLDVPKLDPNLAREAAAKKQASGVDDFK